MPIPISTALAYFLGEAYESDSEAYRTVYSVRNLRNVRKRVDQY